MSPGRPTCLVLTLFSGENEFERCRAALTEQTWTHWEQRVFEHLPNREAHEALYAEIMRNADRFDCFVKLDADMVLRGPEKLAEMMQLFAGAPDLDHAMFELHDFMSDGPLMGLHVFSNRVRWTDSGERLFVDPDPRIPGRRAMVREPPAPVAWHAPDPSPYQAFHFGVHRALKAFQPGRRDPNHDQALKQWRLLTRVWDHFVRTRDRRLGLAVLGADLVWSRAIGPTGAEFDDEQTRRRFEECADETPEALHGRLRPRWRPGPRRAARWASTGGVQVLRGLVRSRLAR